MNELRPHSRELLEAARREHTPSAAVRARLLTELLLAAEPGPASRSSLMPRQLSLASKVVLLAALAAMIGLTLYFASHGRR
ncbi:MAG TPA: hypothetical protein VEQ59_01735 [Polyangiaceae bacterium]|nr:hypothetical protein [Polyangiaceae bacterium]